MPEPVSIPADGVFLQGDLAVPADALGIVIFAHGSGSSRLSPRNNYVAHLLREKGLATLLFDLLTPEEDRNYANRFDIDLLTQRLLAATAWVQKQPSTSPLAPGYFGASTGAAAALRAAAAMGETIRAVVSRGGRPDLAWDVLDKVLSPTLLIVGELDELVLELNQRAFERLRCEKALAVVPGAGHLFEEPGALDEVARLAGEWFTRHLR
ncbi:MAG: alpha/beta hydrolase [Gammaproteobacteria bacterium]|nr:MAG: alpha/beta hydrolase [Gammaproteobacteria bacterium]